MDIRAGTTGLSINISLFNNITGALESGKAYNSSGINISYARAGTARVAITPITLTSPDAVYSSGGFKEIDVANMIGVYRFDIPNAALIAGTTMVTIYFEFDGIRSQRFDINLTMVGTDGANTTVPDAAGVVEALIETLNDITAAEVIATLKTSVGWTIGGTWTYNELIMRITAHLIGRCADKSGEENVLQFSDAETPAEIVLEETTKTATPYRNTEAIQ